MVRTLIIKHFNVAIVSVLILILSGSCSVKQDRKRGPHVAGGASGIEFMTLFDLNKDGKISHDEWEEVKPSTQYRAKRWPLYDKNSDWAITITEVPLKKGESEPAPPKEKKFKITSKQIVFIAKYDKNNDLKISKKEYKGLDFSQFDKNGDGFIEPHEAPRN